MTLDELCTMAARYSDRYDEFEKNDDDEYEDDALHYFNVFKDAINEAYREVSREMALPDHYEQVIVDNDGYIDLTNVTPQMYAIKNLFDADITTSIPYKFFTKYIIEPEAQPGTTLTVYYHYQPDPLEELTDTPVFTDAQVDPMIYVCLACARIWYSEKKFDYGNQWMQQYRMLLRSVRNSMKDHTRRRIPRGIFR